MDPFSLDDNTASAAGISGSRGGNFSRTIKAQAELEAISQRLSLTGEESIKFPKIVVVGDQSAGKSSVLQRIAGVEFIPTADRVCTLVPLQIRLRNDPDQQEPAAFFHLPRNDEHLDVAFARDWEAACKSEKATTDFKEVRQLIASQQEHILRTENRHVSNTAVGVTIVSRDLIDINLIDLPGLQVTNTNKPELPGHIRKLLKFVVDRDEEMILLTIVDINRDPESLASLSFLREIQSQPVRGPDIPSDSREPTFSPMRRSEERLHISNSIAVLTHVDKLDSDSEKLGVIRDLSFEISSDLANSWPTFEFGYVPVYTKPSSAAEHRSEFLQREEEFFIGNTGPLKEVYHGGKAGTQFLIEKLEELLVRMLRERASDLITHLRARREHWRAEVRRLGSLLDDEKRRASIGNAVSDLRDFYKTRVLGDFDDLTVTDEDITSNQAVLDIENLLTVKLSETMAATVERTKPKRKTVEALAAGNQHLAGKKFYKTYSATLVDNLEGDALSILTDLEALVEKIIRSATSKNLSDPFHDIFRKFICQKAIDELGNIRADTEAFVKVLFMGERSFNLVNDASAPHMVAILDQVGAGATNIRKTTLHVNRPPTRKSNSRCPGCRKEFHVLTFTSHYCAQCGKRTHAISEGLCFVRANLPHFDLESVPVCPECVEVYANPDTFVPKLLRKKYSDLPPDVEIRVPLLQSWPFGQEKPDVEVRETQDDAEGSKIDRMVDAVLEWGRAYMQQLQSRLKPTIARVLHYKVVRAIDQQVLHDTGPVASYVRKEETVATILASMEQKTAGLRISLRQAQETVKNLDDALRVLAEM